MSEAIIAGPLPPTKRENVRVPELDGIRAIAVWMVLSGHLVDGWPLAPGALRGIPGPVIFAFRGGWLGVDLFFVLSGLLITGILLDSRTKPAYFRNFYGRRALRILPVYFSVIAIAALFYRDSWHYFLLAIGFMANLAAYFRIGVPHGPGVFWSLAVEEHFYLGWPLAVRFCSRRALWLISLGLFCGEPLARAFGYLKGLDPGEMIYPASWFRFDGLALGALLALWLRSPSFSRRASLQIAGLMLFVSVLILVAGKPFGVLGTRTLASTSLRYTHMQLLFGSGILASLALQGSAATAFLRIPLMRISAELSYCVYLIHLCVGDGYHWLLDRFSVDLPALIGAQPAWICQCIAVLVGSFGLAALSKKYLEEPCLRLK